jgi:transcription initiation factor TFIIB
MRPRPRRQDRRYSKRVEGEPSFISAYVPLCSSPVSSTRRLSKLIRSLAVSSPSLLPCQTFANDEGDDPSRVGAASNPLDGPETFETSISFRDGNSGISRELQRAAARASTKTEKTLSTAYQEISHLCDKIQLGKNITDTAKQLFKRASEEGVLRGKKEEAIIAACVFIACRMGKSPRTFKEICTLTNVPKKVLGQCYKALERAFEVKASGNGSIESPATNVPSSYISAPSTSESSSSTSYDPSAPILMVAPGISQSAYDNASSESETLVISQMLPRFISNLGLTKLSGFQSATLHVLICGKALGLIDGRSPLTVVGSLLYFMCHLWGAGKSPKEICAVVDTTEGTIRARYKDLVDRKDVLVKKEWLESGKADLERLPR